MDLRVKLYEKLVNRCIMLRLVDLDNEGESARVVVYISNCDTVLEQYVDHLSLSPLDILVKDTPITGNIHEITAKVFDLMHTHMHDADTRFIKLGQ
jgi:hypothetical protein